MVKVRQCLYRRTSVNPWASIVAEASPWDDARSGTAASVPHRVQRRPCASRLLALLALGVPFVGVEDAHRAVGVELLAGDRFDPALHFCRFVLNGGRQLEDADLAIIAAGHELLAVQKRDSRNRFGMRQGGTELAAAGDVPEVG